MRYIYCSLYRLIPAVLLICCQCTPQEQQKALEKDDLSAVPEWTKEAIWYQIFVERFRNGDPLNDPQPDDLKAHETDSIPDNWTVTDWGHDWYEREPWQAYLGKDEFYTALQFRRYGGDLQGVLDQLDYIEQLGINAIYFNPLNDARSLHKYDARNYRHIDRNFGPDPKGDIAIMAREEPANAETWQWTAADSLFLKVIGACHKRNIRVLMDYSWNHTGTDFWAFRDVMKHGRASEFADWYHIQSFDDPDTPENEFDYEGWAGIKGLPVFKKTILPETDREPPFEGNLSSESLKQHIYAVSARWMDPNRDGEFDDGVDGFRLDVSGEIPYGFWRDYRKFVKSINPEVYLVGEIWWQHWPDSLMNPRPFLQGGQYDAIMNYRWYRIARGLFAQAEPILTPTGFKSEIERIHANIGDGSLYAMMNMSASHDTPRLSTSFINKKLNKYQVKPNEDADYYIGKPDNETLREQKMFLLHQFSFVGAPQIWNGDEVGMWGADDPDCRKPMLWDDIEYEDETAHYFPDRERRAEAVKPDKALYAHYRQLCSMRARHKALTHGDLQFVLTDDERMSLAYTRAFGGQYAVCVFNISDRAQQLSVKVPQDGSYHNALDTSDIFEAGNHTLRLTLGAKQGVVLINN